MSLRDEKPARARSAAVAQKVGRHRRGRASAGQIQAGARIYSTQGEERAGAGVMSSAAGRPDEPAASLSHLLPQLLRPRAAHDAPLAPPAHLCRHPPPTRTRPRRLPTSLVLISPPNSTRLPSFAMSFQLSMDCQKRGRDDYEQGVSPSKRSRVRASSPLLPPPLVLPFRAPAVLLPPVSPAQLGSRASTSAPLRT